MSPEETEETLTQPDKRIIKQITVKDSALANKLFNDLMGNGIENRKEFVKQYSKEATGNV